MDLQAQNSSSNSSADAFLHADCSDMKEGILSAIGLSAACSLLCLPACVAVLWEMHKKHKNGSPVTSNDVYVLNLTIMDTVFLCFAPAILHQLLFSARSPFASFLIVIMALSTAGRPLFMSCICVDCYLAVVHPLTFQARKSLAPRIIASAAVWAITATFAVLQVFASFALVYLTILPCYVVLVIIVFCDFFIYRTLRRPDPQGRKSHPQKKKALQVLFTSLVMVVISYFPPVMLFSIGFALNVSQKLFLCTLIPPSFLCSVFGSALMPVITLKNQGKFDGIKFWHP